MSIQIDMEGSLKFQIPEPLSLSLSLSLSLNLFLSLFGSTSGQKCRTKQRFNVCLSYRHSKLINVQKNVWHEKYLVKVFAIQLLDLLMRFAQAEWYYINTVEAWVGHMIAIIDINGVENHVPAQVVLFPQGQPNSVVNLSMFQRLELHTSKLRNKRT